ncbi:MAG: DUF262 domain-containing protein [Desulfurivibrionaceae bacterium]|jgi:hypothetical protein
MTLDQEVQDARKEIVSDGYDMSLGEVINLYKEKELKIKPEFQRLFRWDITRKTRFIESILLGIPIPPIFVFQDDEGGWELIDGLQRLSTVFEFVGALVKPDGDLTPPSKLDGTSYLPSLANSTWQKCNEGDVAISKTQQLQIKRARIRVEILLKESDEQAKYELFQRLNTGGAPLSEQEVRNCVTVMIKPELHTILSDLSRDVNFSATTCLTETAIEKQMGVELVLRFFSFRNVPYTSGLDVHEYLDKALVIMAKNDHINWAQESANFSNTFQLINASLGQDSFKRYDAEKFKGMFLMSSFEVLAHGISHNIQDIQTKNKDEATAFIVGKAKALWENEIFQKNSGAGVRGTTRLANLLPFAKEFMKP